VAMTVLGSNNVLIIQNADQVTAVFSPPPANAPPLSREDVEHGYRIGITAGTSTPIEVVEKVERAIREIFDAG